MQEDTPGKGRVAVLYSGGKDSVYTLHRARELTGLEPVALFMKPSLPWPNPHELNRSLMLETLRLLRIDWVVLEPRGDPATTIVEALRVIGARAIATGDIYLWDHVYWVKGIAEKAGVDVVMPMFNRDTELLLRDVVGYGIEYTIIAVKEPGLRRILGLRVHEGNVDWFLDEARRLGIDPMGEFAEYHTVVNKAPGFECELDMREYSRIQTLDGQLHILAEPAARC